MAAVVFIFLDGFGMGPPGPDNPLSQHPWPRLRALLGAAPVLGESVSQATRLLRPVDAVLGVQGAPQSATGQVSLFTGRNAQQVLGFHLSAYPNTTLRALLEEDNLLSHVVRAGGRATFANAYSQEYFEAVAQRKRRHSATTLCVLAAGIPFRNLEDLRESRAVMWDITGAALEKKGYRLSQITPVEAGRRLAALTKSHELVLFECFQADRLGHEKEGAAALRHLTEVDELIGACVESLSADASLLICSDHGNLEDLSTGGHSCNPVPLIVIGPAAPHFAAATAITDVVPALYRALGLP